MATGYMNKEGGREERKETEGGLDPPFLSAKWFCCFPRGLRYSAHTFTESPCALHTAYPPMNQKWDIPWGDEDFQIKLRVCGSYSSPPGSVGQLAHIY